MNKNINIAKLEARVLAAQGITNEVIHDEQMRNIAYCSAGNLSRGSTNKLRAWRDKSAKAIDKSLAGKVALSVAKDEPQIGYEIVSKFVTLSTPVELSEHQALISQHPDTITAGDLGKLLRIIIGKFDKRLARSLTITLLMKNRTVVLTP